MTKIKVKLFGTTTVVLPDGSVVTDLGGIKPRQVLELLAIAPGTPVSKDRLVEHLWGDNPPRTHTATLESYISLLRRRMGCSRGRQSALSTTSNGYLLDATQVEVDVEEFRRLTQSDLSATPDMALARATVAFGLVTGQLLASEPHADWAAEERSQFHDEYLHGLNRAAVHALDAGAPDTAVEMARQAIGCDAMSETSWQLLMRALAETGNRSEALRAYLDLRRTLADELGTEPSPASRSLYLELLAQDWHQPATPTRSVADVRTLLELLRDALDGFPDIDLSVNDGRKPEAVLPNQRRTMPSGPVGVAAV
jgi:DNA-binding SARP family transcriptional activator